MADKNTRYITTWHDLSHETDLEEPVGGQTEEQVIERLRHWFREGSPAGWCAFHICPDAPNQQGQTLDAGAFAYL